MTDASQHLAVLRDIDQRWKGTGVVTGRPVLSLLVSDVLCISPLFDDGIWTPVH